MSACKSCDAVIRWAVTVNGKRIPLEFEPSPDGNVRVLDGIAHVHRDPDAATAASIAEGTVGEPRYLPHHSRCPYAARHKGPTR